MHAEKLLDRIAGSRGTRMVSVRPRSPDIFLAQLSVIVPDRWMIVEAARLTTPVPLPVAPAKIPVPPTIVCVISKKVGAPCPFPEPGENVLTMLSCIRSVLPSSKVIVRPSQLGPQASNTTIWYATCPKPEIVALPHDVPGGQVACPPAFSTNVASYLIVVTAIAGAATTNTATRAQSATENLIKLNMRS